MRSGIRPYVPPFPAPAALSVFLLLACAAPAPKPAGYPAASGAADSAGTDAAEDSGDPAPPPRGEDTAGIRFQIIYVIHGDAGYTYYDKAGDRHLADTEAVAQAEEVARNSPAAEVFIFHQKPTPFLWFFRGSDGTLRQYRKGKAVRTQGYDRATREDDLGAEAALFRKYAAFPVPRICPAHKTREPEVIDAFDTAQATPKHTASESPARFFLYFGHEIPVTGGIPYSRSRPDMAFSVASFARGLERFGGPGCPHAKPFSLIVLSACHGGTPASTEAIAPYASYLLASPGELHLSYLDTRAMARLARENPIPFETAHAEAWGRTIAMESFARLREKTGTAITLSLYDTEKAAAYLEARKEAWRIELPAGKRGRKPAPPLAPDVFHDCSENPSFGSGGEEAGVTVYYHAPLFGADQAKVFHSGWECPAVTPHRLGSAE